MFEDRSYDIILKEMLDKVPGKVDKQEGSIIYDALAPAAYTIATMYRDIAMVYKETFGDTASYPMLKKRAKEREIEPYPAKAAVYSADIVFDYESGVTPEDLIGKRFSIGKLYFLVTEYKLIDSYEPEDDYDAVYYLKCETDGKTSDIFEDETLIPVDYINGLQYARIIECIDPGADEEDVEDFRQRYIKSLDAESYGGNVANYEERTRELLSGGGVKVIPAHNEKIGGVVKLIIIGKDYKAPSADLVLDIKQKMDPLDYEGDGKGIAPIGHKVIVKGVKEVPIDIKLKIDYSSYSGEDKIEDKIRLYFWELAKSWDKTKANEGLVIHKSQIISYVLGIKGIIDVAVVELNRILEVDNTETGVEKSEDEYLNEELESEFIGEEDIENELESGDADEEYIEIDSEIEGSDDEVFEYDAEVENSSDEDLNNDSETESPDDEASDENQTDTDNSNNNEYSLTLEYNEIPILGNLRYVR